MRKWIVTLMASLLSCSTAFAFWPEAADSSLEVGVGYRRDKLEWKTRFDTGSSGSGYDNYSYDDTCCGLPRRLESKLKWKNLNIWQIEARGKYVTCDNIYLRANGDYGWITSGKNTDSDFTHPRHFRRLENDNSYDGYYNDDNYYDNYNSEFEFCHSDSRVRGHVYDAKIALGYQFKMCDNSFAVAPLIGYSWHGQHLKDRHLKQDFYHDDNHFDKNHARGFESDYSYDSDYSYSYDSCSYSGDHSRYHTRWNGPFIGLDLEYYFGCWCDFDWQIFGAYEFHWAHYHARAHWDLRRDLCDGFTHRARDAYGHYFDIGFKWDFCECWSVAIKGEFQWWWADKGRDRAKTFEASCGDFKRDCFAKIPLRDIRWQSAGVSVLVGMTF